MVSTADCQHLEELIRRADIQAAQKFLLKLNTSQIPRELSARLGELYRRAGLFHHAIRLLNKIVRADRPLTESPTPREQAEYAMALIRTGAFREGRKILEAVDARSEPVAGFYLALSFFPEWDYQRSLGPLERFVSVSDIDDYYRAIAEVNLISAYLFLENFDLAASLIAQCLQRTKKQGNHLLRANLLECLAQLELNQRQYGKAIAALDESEAILAKSGLFDELYVRKWRALIESYQSQSPTALLEVRNKALEAGHWETVRDLDFHACRLLGDESLYHRLFHGTPYPCYRQMLIDRLKTLPPPPESYDWSVGHAASVAPVVDLSDGSIDGLPTSLKVGQLPHRLLKELASDFYRPVRLTALAASLFEGEFYHPDATPNRVYQIVRRLREWAAEYKLPLRVNEVEGAYALASDTAVVIRISPQRSLPSGSFNSQLKTLASLGLEQPFTSQLAAEKISCSLSTATRLLNAGIEAGVVEKVMIGKRARYRFS